MKKSISTGFMTGILAFSAYASVWIVDNLPEVIHSTCEIILDEHLYEDLINKNIKFLEELKSHGFHPLRMPEDPVGQYLYLDKNENEIIIKGVGDDGAKFCHSYGHIPFCGKLF